MIEFMFKAGLNYKKGRRRRELKSKITCNYNEQLPLKLIQENKKDLVYYKIVVWCQRTFFKLADTFVSVRNWVRELNQLQASPDQLSTLRSFVWIPSWHPGQFLARVQAGSVYEMTTSAVSFLSTLFFFGRLKGAGREQPHFAHFKSCVPCYRIPCWLQTSFLRKCVRKRAMLLTVHTH